MASTLLPPASTPPDEAVRPSDGGGNGGRGGDIEERHYGPNENPDGDPERWATPLSAYRTIALFAVFSISSVFATLTHVLASRWVQSKDWVPASLPHILYFNTVVLLISSLTIELARYSLVREAFQRSQRWLLITLLLGITFVAGQVEAWRYFVARGLHFTSNPGTFFFYFLTATHSMHLLGGMLALSYITLFANRLIQRNRQKTAVSTVAFYWHFMDGLWLYLFVLLFVTIQR